MVSWPKQTLDEAPISSVSEWSLNSIEEVSGVLGVSFECLESMAWELFTELEKKVMGGIKGDLVFGSDPRVAHQIGP